MRAFITGRSHGGQWGFLSAEGQDFPRLSGNIYRCLQCARCASFELQITAVIALVPALLSFVLLVDGGPTMSTVHSAPLCHDWGVYSEGAVRVLEGQAGWLHCPLFSYPTVYNYSSSLASGLNLYWYRVSPGQDLEQPINLKLPNYYKEREWLWLEPATLQDSGQYICMLRNITSCVKIAVRLEVVQHAMGMECVMEGAVPAQHITIPVQEGKIFTCPDIQMIQLRNLSYSVTWYYYCSRERLKQRLLNIEVKGDSIVVHLMLKAYEGPHTCVVSYEANGRGINFTRVVNVTAVAPSRGPKEPIIHIPAEGKVQSVKLGEETVLKCTALLPYIENDSKELWWTVDGKAVGQLADPRFKASSRIINNEDGDETQEVELRIQDVTKEDLHRTYNCSARNSRGNATRKVLLREEEYQPYIELGCGLGAIVVIMISMFVIYHIFWLEILLFYRASFGTDERSTDDKEYDVYISYARNGEEEEFVLSTLRRVLENELGYSVCIFDRDSLPGGIITDETLNFLNRSRRLIVVVSPQHELQGTQALLELRAGLDTMVWGGSLRVILVQYKPISRGSWVKELRRARVVLAFIRWEGDKSLAISSRFWKRLQVELPLRRADSLSEKYSNTARLIKSCDMEDSGVTAKNKMVESFIKA
ncbi:interleukin-1 receptor accessory protein isoform X2 [Denticeps clupeoides]|uniref:interleukin-1 receptor accessory protein isoform X2 n=1 Tax=Denticeps clupeoides TaxID=299321 RepID=UPI0010A50B06|nr:interleukin-1 receptor accessory protein-like isoform X2 [Denticeps clupeoides]